MPSWYDEDIGTRVRAAYDALSEPKGDFYERVRKSIPRRNRPSKISGISEMYVYAARGSIIGMWSSHREDLPRNVGERLERLAYVLYGLNFPDDDSVVDFVREFASSHKVSFRYPPVLK